MKSILLIPLFLLFGCASADRFPMRHPTKVSAVAFDRLLRGDSTIQDVERALGEPRLSGGTLGVSDIGSTIDLPRFDYALAIARGSKEEVVFVSFWFRGSRLESAYVRDPKTLENLQLLFPIAADKKPNQSLQPTAPSRRG
jgi:hypothetical protein